METHANKVVSLFSVLLFLSNNQLPVDPALLPGLAEGPQPEPGETSLLPATAIPQELQHDPVSETAELGGVRDQGSSPHTLGRRHWASSLGSVSSGKTAVGPALYLQGCSEITGTDFPTRGKHAWPAAIIYYVTINW